MAGGGDGTAGRRANQDDLAEVAACLASAFYGDPLWGHWTFPDEHERTHKLPALMMLMAEMGIAGDESTWMTPGAGSVTVWTPPGARYGEPGFDERIETVVTDLFGKRAGEVDALFEQFTQNEPAGSFHHLEWWATRRNLAGQGLGGSLIKEDLARVDAEHLPSYLESTNPVNIPRYEALGFLPVCAFAPTGGPVITGMWREAR